MNTPHTNPSVTLWVWRHPKPDGVAGRCVGRTDVPVDPRRSKRLARRIQATARREHLPRVVFTSPLQRAADVGRWLRRWGWAHRVDAALLETDRQLAANGIATAYHALTLSWEPGLRSVMTGWQVVRALDLLRPWVTVRERYGGMPEG